MLAERKAQSAKRIGLLWILIVISLHFMKELNYFTKKHEISKAQNHSYLLFVFS
jgi:hypothetical protein